MVECQAGVIARSRVVSARVRRTILLNGLEVSITGMFTTRA